MDFLGMKLENNNIFCSISSGYSSVLMAIKIKEWYPNHNIIFAMANTSKERVESLKFMNECDRYFGLDMVWIESVINQEHRKGTDFKIVTYENLKHNGELFEQGIKKYGIPCSINKWCSRELKLVPLKKYADSIFGQSNYSIAVGIREDEMDRVSEKYEENNIFYPLVENHIDSDFRNKFWKNQNIQISIPAFKGNCDLCFEKSNRKLMTILKDEQYLGNWWQNMINKYGNIPLEGKASYNDLMKANNRMTFFREFNDINKLSNMAKRPFIKATDEYVYENNLFDFEGSCGSGCIGFI